MQDTDIQPKAFSSGVLCNRTTISDCNPASPRSEMEIINYVLLSFLCQCTPKTSTCKRFNYSHPYFLCPVGWKQFAVKTSNLEPMNKTKPGMSSLGLTTIGHEIIQWCLHLWWLKASHAISDITQRHCKLEGYFKNSLTLQLHQDRFRVWGSVFLSV